MVRYTLAALVTSGLLIWGLVAAIDAAWMIGIVFCAWFSGIAVLWLLVSLVGCYLDAETNGTGRPRW